MVIALLLYCWSRSVRSSRAIERACVTARDGVIKPSNLPPDVGRGDTKSPLQVDLTRPLPVLGEPEPIFPEVSAK